MSEIFEQKDNNLAGDGYSKNNIPSDWIEERVARAGTTIIFGIPFSELDRDELLAVAIEGWESKHRQLEEDRRQARFQSELSKLREFFRG